MPRTDTTFGQGQRVSRKESKRRRKPEIVPGTIYTAEELRAIQAAMREAVLARLGIKVGR